MQRLGGAVVSRVASCSASESSYHDQTERTQHSGWGGGGIFGALNESKATASYMEVVLRKTVP